MQLRILGPVQMNVHEEPVVIGATKVRGLLGVMAYKANEPVPVDYLATALWDNCPPDPAKTLKVYLSRLRRALTESGFPGDVVGEHGVYRFEIEPSAVDYHRFMERVRAGRRASGRGEHAAAAEMFTTAVEMWRGPPLVDIKSSWARRLQEVLTARNLLPAQCGLLEANLALGEHDLVLNQLHPLLADHPHEERFAKLWIRALVDADRASEIPAFYRSFRQRLESDLDTEPTVELIETYQQAMSPQPPMPLAPQQTVRVPGPPRDTPYFTGRAELLAQLDELLARPDAGATVVALDGRPGIGKTTLVRHWARHNRNLFPDGMLHMDLAGYAGTNPIEPSTVMAIFLDELGIPPQQIPPGREDRAALLRRTLAGRRLLMILDNVRDSAHVRPLLDAVADSPILVTSRQRLTSLTYRDGAERVTVPELTVAEAIALFEKRLGQRALAEPDAIIDLVLLCDRLPLAVRIVSEHVAMRPEAPIRDLVNELRNARRLLDAGAHGDDETTTLRSAFSWSHHALQPGEARLFRLLGLLPGVRFSVGAAAAVSGLDRHEVDRALDALVGAHLIEQERGGQFRTHDLLHQYATDSAHHDEPTELLDRAMRRLLTWYVGSARNARPFLTADPHEVADLPDPEPVQPTQFDSTDDARQWFARERTNLVALTRTAAEQHHYEYVWRLAACLNVVNNYGDLHEMLEVHQLGRTAAAYAGQLAAEAGCLNNMGEIYSRLDDNLRAGQCFEQAHQAFQRAGDTHGEAVCLHNIAVIHAKLGAPADALIWHRQALAAFTAANNEWAMANVHRWMGDSNRELRRYDEASSHYLHARYISNKIGDECGQGAALNRLARLSLDTDRLHDAINFGEDALDIHDRTGDRINAAKVLCTLAAVHIRLGAHAQAISHLQEAVRVHQDMRNDGARAHTLALLGDAYAATGEPDTARETWTTAADLLDTLNDPGAHELRTRARHPNGTVPTPRSDTLRPPAYPVRIGSSEPDGTATGRGPDA